MDLRNADIIEEVIKVNEISTESCSTMVLIDRKGWCYSIAMRKKYRIWKGTGEN